jgi:hypothetical protein
MRFYIIIFLVLLCFNHGLTYANDLEDKLSQEKKEDDFPDEKIVSSDDQNNATLENQIRESILAVQNASTDSSKEMDNLQQLMRKLDIHTELLKQENHHIRDSIISENANVVAKSLYDLHKKTKKPNEELRNQSQPQTKQGLVSLYKEYVVDMHNLDQARNAAKMHPEDSSLQLNFQNAQAIIDAYHQNNNFKEARKLVSLNEATLKEMKLLAQNLKKESALQTKSRLQKEKIKNIEIRKERNRKKEEAMNYKPNVRVEAEHIPPRQINTDSLIRHNNNLSTQEVNDSISIKVIHGGVDHDDHVHSYNSDYITSDQQDILSSMEALSK